MNPQGTTIAYPKDKEEILRGLRETYERLKAEGKIPAEPMPAPEPVFAPVPPSVPTPAPAIASELQNAVNDIAKELEGEGSAPAQTPESNGESVQEIPPELAPELTPAPAPAEKMYDPASVGVVSTAELNDIKTEAERLRGAIGFQRYMAALTSKDPLDQQYVEAIQAINDVDKGDIKGLYQKYAAFIDVAKKLAPGNEAAPSGYDAIPPTSVPVEPQMPAPLEMPADIPVPPPVPAMPAEVPQVAAAPVVAPEPPLPDMPGMQEPVPAAPPSSTSSPSSHDPYRELIEDVPSPDPVVPPSLPDIPLPEKPPAPEPAPPPVQEMTQADTGAAEEVAVLAQDEGMQEAAPADTSQENVPQEDPIMHPEVTSGLEQLLSEWDIFASSGLFGFGSGGIEHPMYKKIRELPVATVMSGRWDGASAKVTANIQSYMDGWRKERGIDARPEETFETYLRRVVYNILSA